MRDNAHLKTYTSDISLPEATESMRMDPLREDVPITLTPLSSVSLLDRPTMRSPVTALRDVLDSHKGMMRTIALKVPGSDKFTVVKISSINDGNCLFHSVCNAFYTPYKTEMIRGSYISKGEIADKFRRELVTYLEAENPSDPLRRSNYDSILGGSLPSFSTSEYERFSLEALKSHLNSNEHVGEEVILIVGEAIGRSIFIIDATTMDVYLQPDIPEKSRAICILWNGIDHYDLIGVYNSNGISVTDFSIDDPFIMMLRNRTHSLNANRSKKQP